MKSVRLSIEHSAETIHPMHAFVCDSPAVEREVLLEGKREGEVRTLLFYVEGDAHAYQAAIEAQDRALEYDIKSAEDEGFFVYVRAPNSDAEAPLFEAFDRETVVVAGPIEFRPDRTMRIRLVGHGPQLGEIVEDLPDCVNVDVLDVGPYDRALRPGLTERQRDAISVAWKLGYYAVPRETDIEAVATRLDGVDAAAARRTGAGRQYDRVAIARTFAEMGKI